MSHQLSEKLVLLSPPGYFPKKLLLPGSTVCRPEFCHFLIEKEAWAQSRQQHGKGAKTIHSNESQVRADKHTGNGAA